eukprot:gene17-136_t
MDPNSAAYRDLQQIQEILGSTQHLRQVAEGRFPPNYLSPELHQLVAARKRGVMHLQQQIDELFRDSPLAALAAEAADQDRLVKAAGAYSLELMHRSIPVEQ